MVLPFPLPLPGRPATVEDRLDTIAERTESLADGISRIEALALAVLADLSALRSDVGSLRDRIDGDTRR